MFYKVKVSKFKTKKLIEFNKNLNNFFDIKTVIYLKENNSIIQTKAKYLAKDYKKYKLKELKNIKKKIISLKKLKYINFTKSPNKMLIKQIQKFLKKNNNIKFFDYFIIHGSYASNDFIKDFSDLDTFVVIKDECIEDWRKLINLREELKKFYNILLKYSPFQHHGLICFTNADLKNYSNNLLPVEALKYNLSLINKEKNLIINSNLSKASSHRKSLKERLYFIKLAIKKGFYEHHVFGNKMLKVPLERDDKCIKQFITHVNYMLNIPILFLSSINKNSHKKNSFKIFYKKINNNKIKSFIIKHEFFRKNWKRFKSYKQLNTKIFNYFGKDYFSECKMTIEYVLEKIRTYER